MNTAADEAERFLLEHAHYDEDLDFWRRTAATLGGPVLDLGAAAGRVAVPLARDGHEVIALDASAEMLAALRSALGSESPATAARVVPVLATFTDFDLGRRVPLAICAMNTLQVLTEPDDQRACLRRVRDHLLDDGELVFDVILPDFGEILASLGQLRRIGSTADDASGRTMMHWACYEDFDPITQTAEVLTVIDDFVPGSPLTRRVRRQFVHVYLPAELHHLLARCGLEVIQAFGDFDGGPVDGTSQRQVYRCRRAEGAA